MNLHFALADAEFIGNDLVGFTSDDQVHHFAFASSQLYYPIRDLRFSIAGRAPLLVGLECLGYLIQQFLVSKRLLDEINRALLHNFAAHGEC